MRFLDVVFAYQSRLFALLAYLILFKSRNMSEYRWCLAANVGSTYLFVLAMYFYKPFAIATGYYIVPLGLVAKLGPKGHFYYLIGICALPGCHSLAIGLCIVYQAMQVPTTSRLTTWLQSAARFVMRSGVHFAAFYSLVAVSTWFMVVGYFLQASVDLVPDEIPPDGKLHCSSRHGKRYRCPQSYDLPSL